MLLRINCNDVLLTSSSYNRTSLYVSPASMLSEKAQGKQRAVEPQDDTSESAGPSRKTLVVRFTEGFPDLTVAIQREDTIRELKRNVRPNML